jgi:hypothetical protein
MLYRHIRSGALADAGPGMGADGPHPASPVSMYSKAAPSGCLAMSLAPFGAGDGPSMTSPPAGWRAPSTGARLPIWIVAVRSRKPNLSARDRSVEIGNEHARPLAG